MGTEFSFGEIKIIKYIEIFIAVCIIKVGIHVYISLLCHWRGPRCNDDSVVISTPSTLILLLYMYFPATPCSL